MKSIRKTFFSLLMIPVLLFCMPVAAEAESGAENEKQLVIISDMGSHEKNPENSFPAIRDAVREGADIIRIPVQKTKDGRFVLSRDETLARMCGAGETPISQMTAEEIGAFELKESTGGGTPLTDETVPELTAVLNTWADRVEFLIDFSWDERDAVLSAARGTGKETRCIFVCREGVKKALQWQEETGGQIRIAAYEKTNVVMTAQSAAKQLAGQKNMFLWLATSNQNGMIFNECVTKLFPAVSGIMIQITDPKQGGRRLDTEEYWEDLTARGYNMLITDYAAGMKEYDRRSDAAREKLTDTVMELQANWQLPDFSGRAFREYRFRYQNALTAAQEKMNCGFSGVHRCEEAEFELIGSVNDINSHYDELAAGKAGLTVTPGRIAAVLIAAAAFTALEVFLHRHRGRRKEKNP